MPSKKSRANKPVVPLPITTPLPVATPAILTPATAEAPQSDVNRDHNVFDDLKSAELYVKARGLMIDGFEHSEGGDHHISYVFHTLSWSSPEVIDTHPFLTSCLLDVQVVRKLRSPDAFSKPTRLNDTNHVTVHALKDRPTEMGLFATATIPNASLILSERPSVVFPTPLSMGILGKDISSLCDALFKGLLPHSDEKKNRVDHAAVAVTETAPGLQNARLLC
jgi:hypothetical protein